MALPKSRKPQPKTTVQQPRRMDEPKVPYSGKEPTFYSIYDKPKKPRKPVLTVLADVIDSIGEFVFSPDFGVILGRCVSISALVVSSLFYGTFIIPASMQFLPLPVFNWALGAGLSVAAAIAVQTLEIWPRRFKYFPELADKAAYKAGMERFTNPKEDPNASIMIGKFKYWARTADARKIRAGEIVSGITYLLESVGSIVLIGTVIILNAPWAIKLGALFWAAYSVFGCEAGLWIADNAKTGRLNAKQAASYRAEKARLEAMAQSDMSRGTHTIDI